MSLFMSSSVSDWLHNFAIFRTSLVSLLTVFQTEEAMCITTFWGSFLTILTDKGVWLSHYQDIVIHSLEKIAQEVLKNRANIPEDVIIDSKDDDHHVNVSIYNTLAIPTDFSVQESLIWTVYIVSSTGPPKGLIVDSN